MRAMAVYFQIQKLSEGEISENVSFEGKNILFGCIKEYDSSIVNTQKTVRKTL